MARYTGATTKIARRFGEAIFGPSKALQKKNYGPGQHGRGKRRKQSEYAVQLAAKQKAKYTYGVLERQFSNLFQKAARKEGITGENLLKLLEARLDNVVFRFGISPTRAGARQLVLHKHITVNGEVVNIASFSVKPGDVVAVRENLNHFQPLQIALQVVMPANSTGWNGIQKILLASLSTIQAGIRFRKIFRSNSL